MANFGDLVGAFMQSTMAPSGSNRVGSALEHLQRSGFGGTAGAGATGPGTGGLLGGILNAVQGGLSSAARSPGQAGGLGALVGSLLGGGKGAMQGGMLAVLASVAMKALSGAGQDAQGHAAGQAGGFGRFPGAPSVSDAPHLPGAIGAALPGNAGPWSGGDAPIGMRAPQNPAEQEALQSTARLVLKGMINAAKSDGQISQDEMQRIVGKLQESGADQGMQQWVMQQMQQPLDVQAFAAEIPNQEVAAQVYAASLLAIEVDTDAERQYLQQFAQSAGLHPLVVGQIHQTLGVTA